MGTLNYDDVLEAVMHSGVETDSMDYADVISNDYSGRSMYGRECFGVTLKNDADMLLFMLELADVLEDDRETVKELAQNMRSDNMGLDYIYYFPGWELEGAPDPEDDEDED